MALGNSSDYGSFVDPGFSQDAIFISRLQMKYSVSVPPEKCGQCPIRGDSICHAIGRDIPSGLASLRCGYLVVRPRRMMVREGSLAREAFRIFSGWAICFKAAANGRRKILDVLLPGDFLTPVSIHDADAPETHAVETLTDASFCAFSPSAVAGFLSEKPLLDGRIALLKRGSARERIAELVLHLRNRLRRREPLLDLEFVFPLRRGELADLLGLTPLQVCRALSGLRHDGFLEISDGTLKILNYEAIGELAN